ncbi:MAG: hypothetical protein JWP20_2082, partial [Roseomonas sp.]|nr:hypothetical protein [Roseomonas sp.]
DPALLEQGPAGRRPRIAADGRQARHVYARPFDRADTRPRIGLVMLGASDPALRRLPAATALALPAAPASLLEQARLRGMETLLLLPPEPTPGTLDAALARFTGYVGVLATPDEGRAPAAETPIAVQEALRARGLLFLDPREGAAAPSHAWGRSADLILEDAPTRGEIDRQLTELERLAHARGSALGILPGPRPMLVERVAAWAAGLPQRGFVLVPVTAMIRRPANAQR